jgi:hypothetical protein
MKVNRRKLELATSSKEYKIYHLALEPWSECSCTIKRWYSNHKWCSKAGRIFRPYHNKAGNCRYGNSHKSWKNYRKTQYRNN